MTAIRLVGSQAALTGAVSWLGLFRLVLCVFKNFLGSFGNFCFWECVGVIFLIFAGAWSAIVMAFWKSRRIMSDRVYQRGGGLKVGKECKLVMSLGKDRVKNCELDSGRPGQALEDTKDSLFKCDA